MGIRPLIVKALQKTGLNRVAHRIYYRHVHGFDTANRAVLTALERSFELAASNGVLGDGDYCEFGIFKGYAFLHAQRTAAQHQLESMRFFGFDSFAGLPPIKAADLTKNDEFYEGQYACSKEHVVANLSSADGGVDWDRTFLVEGYFDRSLTPQLKRDHDLKAVAVALIDCDLYASTVNVLTFLDGLLLDGSVLMFDDWNCFDRDDERGQRRAFGDFLGAHAEWTAEESFAYGDWGQVFVLRGPAQRPRA